MISLPHSGELSCYPDDILAIDGQENQLDLNFDDSESLDESDRKWSFVYTKARQEKALARDLYSFEIPYYLPLVPKDSLIRGRKLRSYVPLFSGYVFLYWSSVERYRSLDTKRIAHVVDISDQRLLRRELSQIQRLIEADVPLTVERRLVVGQRVRVRTGPFSGIEGSLLRAGNVPKLLVAVQYLSQGITLEIEGFKVEPI